MKRIMLLLLVLLTAFSVSSCSVIKDIMGEEKYEKLSGKLSAAWEKVGKDTLAEITDEAWREFGFGRSIDWPKDGIASSLPKFRDGKVEVSYSAESGGYIKLKSVSDRDLDEYISRLEELGYRKTVQTDPFNVLLTFDGTYVGFIKTDSSKCSMVYADSFAGINEIVSMTEVK